MVQEYPVSAEVAVDPSNILQALFDFFEGSLV